MSTTTLTASYLHSLRDLIADDGRAAAYQSLAQYRTALLTHICEQLVALDEVVDQDLIPLEPAGWRAFMTEVASFASCLVHGDTLAAKARALLRRRAAFRSTPPAVDVPKIQEAA
ncbi:hypothetical protein QPK31_02840 [Massilia sp. YIM B02769]|uniref:hypothetical protein n=1 Tax=Massilia sp. YIM B02769 TaxID=3050129 RepID=UPI0025B6C245|nr:hypothetical protein [Massilia sp. YIM B02769]MDN4057154.1 hypothetical protein [Massilia sp. YIM B02769]